MTGGIFFAGILLAIVLCAGLILSSFLATLFVEALRLRPHRGARAFAYCDDEVLPRLGLEEREGLRRYSMVRQFTILLLAVDVAALTMPSGPTWPTLAETVLVAVALTALFGHIIPGVLVTRTDGRWSRAFLPAARIMAWTIRPVLLLTAFASSVAELGGDDPEDERDANGSEQPIDALLDAGEEEGLIDDADRRLIQSVVEFGDKTVREVMTARPDIVAIEASSTVEQLRELLIEEEYSRILVYNTNIDNIVGFVHSRDTLEVDRAERARMRVSEIVRPIALTPETKPIQELMRELQETSSQMTVVVDEYGQTAGLATMEDLMEEIVGEIRDETEPSEDIELLPDRSFIASGNLDVDRLDELAGFRPDNSTTSTTVGGLVCEELGQVPDAGTRVRLAGIEIEVLSADDRRVRSVRVKPLSIEAPADQDPRMSRS